MDTPIWLTRDFLRQFVNQEIVTYSVEFATKPGDNYLSSIYRVSVVTKEEGILSRIVKTIIEKPESREVISALKVFPKEMLVYEEFLPHFERQFYQQTGEKVSFSPQCYYTANELLPLIVLNDLKAQGYELRDRRIGLSVREVRMVLEKVAKFHACSVKRFEELGSYNEDLFGDAWVQGKTENMENYYDHAFETFLWAIENHIENGERYLVKLKQLRGRHFEIFNRLSKPQEGEFNVLAHSDLWINNFLFNGDELTSNDVQLIDYQVSRWSSPAMELFFFFITCCSARTIIDDWDHLIEFYHSHLVTTLEALNCKTKAPKFDDFKADLESKGLMATILIYEALVVTKANPKLDLTGGYMNGTTVEAENIRKEIFSCREFIDELQLLLPHFDKKGYLDFV